MLEEKRAYASWAIPSFHGKSSRQSGERYELYITIILF